MTHLPKICSRCVCCRAAWVLPLLFLFACRHEKKFTGKPLFEILEPAKTGISFSNKLTSTPELNVAKYLYFYNGGGVGLGDFNNDGRIDIYFASSQVGDRMYLNQGNLKFRDVTTAAGIPQDKGWSTGVSVVDINNDGWLDIYVCRVGNHENLHNHNLLLVCQGLDSVGVPVYKDEAATYGLDFSGYSTQAVFFDYDMDGDLDMYLLNHSVHQTSSFGPRLTNLHNASPVSGDRLFRNDGNSRFTDVTGSSGIHSSLIGYGLGIAAGDIDLDGYPDLYIGNDFHENDYLYINQHNGTFHDEAGDRMMHTSHFTMGVDVADVNNDGYPEVISVDMLSNDRYILKRSQGENPLDIFNMKIGFGYNYQYSRNNLQLNRKNGQFSETGLYSGVAATDWSWSPLWFDFDNDGDKDLFISNGIPKRLNDRDYIDYLSSQEIQENFQNQLDKKEAYVLQNFPEIKLANKFFSNDSAMSFSDREGNIANNKKTFSNGAAFADLDNDGDLDLVINNIDDPAMVYENKTDTAGSRNFVDLRLRGPAKNINAIGARLIIFGDNAVRSYEKYPVHGFLSSAEEPIHAGLGKVHVDSAFLIWPDNSYEPVKLTVDSPRMTLVYQTGLPRFDYEKIKNYQLPLGRSFQDITEVTRLLHRHEENNFHEFDREPLLPHLLSTEGPALNVADLNGDGLDDVFIGSSRGKKSSVYLQTRQGTFLQMAEPALDNDSAYEDVSSCVADVNRDGFPDLVVGSAGNEFYGHDEKLMPRVYLNNGHGQLNKPGSFFDSLYVNASVVQSADIDKDGYPDLFIGGRSVPYHYGDIPASYLLRNNGKGKYVDVTDLWTPGLRSVGFVTSMLWFDLDKDGDQDILLTLEWGGIVAFVNENGRFQRRDLTDHKGWWNFLLPVDVDGDGDIDFIAGNMGLNSRLKASPDRPVRMYYNDFDENGIKEQVLTYFIDDAETPFADKDELEKQLPQMKKKYLHAEDFAKASLTDMFGAEKLNAAAVFTANDFSSAVFINEGNWHFRLKPLPWLAQLSPMRDAVVVNANHDSLPDILMVGNYYDNNIQMGRNDADFGTVLINRGSGTFSAETLNGVVLKGESRHIKSLTIGGKPAFIVVENNDSTRIIRYRK